MEQICITYEIEFFNYWHIGSGLSSGAEADAVVLKNNQNLPYVPGKTIKGLLRDALEEIAEIQAQKVSLEQINEIFGNKETMANIQNNGVAFFSNAELSDNEASWIKKEKLSPYLYELKSYTALNENEVAKNGSLRTIEVCKPLSLFGTIELDKKEYVDLIEMALQWQKSIGLNRNRGLGRCAFKVISTNFNN